MAASQLSGSYDVESFERSVFESGYDVFEVVAVFFVDTLSVHDVEFVAKLAVVGFAEE